MEVSWHAHAHCRTDWGLVSDDSWVAWTAKTKQVYSFQSSALASLPQCHFERYPHPQDCWHHWRVAWLWLRSQRPWKVARSRALNPQTYPKRHPKLLLIWVRIRSVRTFATSVLNRDAPFKNEVVWLRWARVDRTVEELSSTGAERLLLRRGRPRRWRWVRRWR